MYGTDATTFCGLWPLEHPQEQLTVTARLVTCADCRARMDDVLAQALAITGPLPPMPWPPPNMEPYDDEGRVPFSQRVQFIREGGAPK